MSILNQNLAYVNRSGTNIPIAKTLVKSSKHAGGLTTGTETIGKIYPGECYTVVKNASSNITNFQVVCRNSAGRLAFGYIETSSGIDSGVNGDEFPWVKYQEPYHLYNSNGTSLVNAAKETINGTTYYIFTVKKAVKYYDYSGNDKGTLAVGTKLATRGSTTGQSKTNCMLFNLMKRPGGSWTKMCIDSHGYGFVDLGFNLGSKPSNRAIF